MREIEFWFDFASPYSHLAAQRIEALAGAAGLALRWRPFLLGPIFHSFGWDTSPFLLQKEKGAHMWVDMERQCRKYGIAWLRPSVFPRNGVLAARVGLWLERAGRAGPFCREVMRLNFSLDRDIGDPGVVAEALAAVGEKAAEVIAAATGEDMKSALREQTNLAKQRGVFGAPTFFAGPALFWGNDRLEDAIAEAAGKNVTNISLN
jgi:2-hydroxychromene-2-carboxylate isomerase